MNLEEQKQFLANLIVEDGYYNKKQAVAMVESYHSYLIALKEGRAKLDTGNGPSAAFWFRKFFANRPTVITGAMGQGKSYLASWLIYRGLVFNPRWDFYTNLPIFTFDYPELTDLAPPHVFPVRSMSELLKGIMRSRGEDRIPVAVLDEMGSEINAYNWSSVEAQSWRIFTQFQRHLGVLGPLLIYHTIRSMPNYLRDGSLTNSVFPLAFHDGKRYILSSATRPYNLVIEGPVIPYGSTGGYGFTVDVDMQLLMRMLWGVTRSDILQKLEKNLDFALITNEKLEKRMKEIEEERKRQEDEQRIFELRREGKTIREISEILDIPKSTVHDFLKKEESIKEE
ncbi:MAG: sigma-70 region 4 domain-containing protein [Candidatus Parvarchaeota archaeon]